MMARSVTTSLHRQPCAARVRSKMVLSLLFMLSVLLIALFVPLGVRRNNAEANVCAGRDGDDHVDARRVTLSIKDGDMVYRYLGTLEPQLNFTPLTPGNYTIDEVLLDGSQLSVPFFVGADRMSNDSALSNGSEPASPTVYAPPKERRAAIGSKCERYSGVAVTADARDSDVTAGTAGAVRTAGSEAPARVAERGRAASHAARHGLGREMSRPAQIIFPPANEGRRCSLDDRTSLSLSRTACEEQSSSMVLSSRKESISVSTSRRQSLVDAPVPERRWSAVYSVDPSAVDFTNGELSATAIGTELYKCRDWDFANQRCLGAWRSCAT